MASPPLSMSSVAHPTIFALPVQTPYPSHGGSPVRFAYNHQPHTHIPPHPKHPRRLAPAPDSYNTPPDHYLLQNLQSPPGKDTPAADDKKQNPRTIPSARWN